ncbi:MAG: hypothetical protein H7A45_10870 [Verrucomicrobiales bacterium]|nr:hypothetical protein [Verrucomicrobiales bacterium]MCP5526835.1 hypothetical protein [Verrucomicrobiales bacterium]
MNRIELCPEERAFLGQLLQQALVSLEIELQHTDHAGFKQLLKARRELIERLASKLPAPTGIAV